MTDLPAKQGFGSAGSMRGAGLSDVFLAHRGHVSDKWEQYLAIYEAELAPFLEAGKPVRLLEIGVQNGGSLQIWRSYLPQGSSIVGIDIDPACAKLELGDGISVLIGDASDPASLDRLLGDAVFDIIVDDGSHRSEHIIAAFESCWRRVAPGGLFIAEDLHCSYFESHGGGFRKADATIEHFKALADAVNADHFEADAAQNADPAEFDRLHSLGRQIARVTFYDSVGVVQRAAETRGAPYRRVLTGLQAPVAELGSMVPRLPMAQLRSLLLSSAAAQAFEPALRGGLIAARETIAMQHEAIAAQRETIVALRGAVEEQRGTITALRDGEAAALAEVATLRGAVEEQRGAITALRDGEAAALAEVAMLRGTVEEQRAALRHEQGVNAALSGSTSWRVTAPMRLLVRAVRTSLASIRITLAMANKIRALIARDGLAFTVRRSISFIGRHGLWRTAALLRAVSVSPTSHTPDQNGTDATAGPVPSPPAIPDLSLDNASYESWVQAHGTLASTDRAVIKAHIAEMSASPLMSVVMPVYNTEPALLQQAIDSIQSQLWPHWELCIADDASTDPRIPALLARAAASDSRIRWMRREANGHISAASNSALALAHGEWVVLVDHDDLIAPDALYEIAVAAAAHPTAQVIYSDEDQIDERGRRSNPYFKPDLDPELLLAQNMVCHLGAYRRDLLEKIGGFRLGLEGSQDHDLVLRCLSEAGADAFVHIPTVLYHWRQTSAPSSFSQASLDRCTAASRRAVADHLAARGILADVVPAPLAPSFNRIIYHLPSPGPLVSVIVPTRDRAELLGPCLHGVLEQTEYPSIEVLIVDNDSVEPATHALFESLAADRRVRILRRPGAFNYPALNNDAVREARGEILLLLNNDTLVIEPDWLRELVSHAARPGIGAVGAKLFYPDRSIQHAGVLLGMGIGAETVAGHYGHGAAANDHGPFGWLALTRSVSAVTAACLAVKRADYLAVGGMDDANLRVAFNDVDFCLRLRAAGLRNIITPHARLLHFESKSRGYEDTLEKQARFASEVRFMRSKWGMALDADPFWNPNLALDAPGHSIAVKPRKARSWTQAN